MQPPDGRSVSSPARCCMLCEATPPVARFRLRGSLVAAEAARRHVCRGQHALPSSTAILAPASSSIDMLGCGVGGRPAWGVVDDAVSERGDTRRRSVQRKCKSRHARARRARRMQAWALAAARAAGRGDCTAAAAWTSRRAPSACRAAAPMQQQSIKACCCCLAAPPVLLSRRASPAEAAERLLGGAAAARWCCSLAGPPASGERGRRRRRLERRRRRHLPLYLPQERRHRSPGCRVPQPLNAASHAHLRTLGRTDVCRRPRAPVVQAQLPVSPCAARPPACSTLALARPHTAPLPASGSARACRSACDVEQRRLNRGGRRRFGCRRLRRRARKRSAHRSPPSARLTPWC